MNSPLSMTKSDSVRTLCAKKILTKGKLDKMLTKLRYTIDFNYPVSAYIHTSLWKSALSHLTQPACGNSDHCYLLG